MKAANYYALLLLLILSTPSKAQFNSNKYDKLFFLLGSVDDYMGYERTFNAASDSFCFQRVDIYYQEELKTALFINSLFSREYTDIYLVNNGTSKGIKIYSKALSSEIDKYLNYTSSSIWTLKGDTVYYGKMKNEVFKTHKQKSSYLLGVFLRYGGFKPMADGRYSLGMSNSPNKASACTQLLKDLGCKNVEYEIKKGYIPVPHMVYFEPNIAVKRLINEAELLKISISKIDTGHIKFTPNGKKFIWKEVEKPDFK